MMAKNTDSETRQLEFISQITLNSCIISSKLFNLSVFQFLHLHNKDNNSINLKGP